MDHDWQALAALAMGDEHTPPNPDPLYWALKHWVRDFERTENGPPNALDDYPEQVEAFFMKLMIVSPTRPCKSEEVAAAAKRAWRACMARDGYEQHLEAAQIAREFGVMFEGETDCPGTPSEIAREAVKSKLGIGVDRLKQILKSKK